MSSSSTGAVADPLAEALAEDQVAVAEPQQKLEALPRSGQPSIRHMCFTSSGMGKNVGWR